MRTHPLFPFLSKQGGWVAHVSTTRHSITYLGSTKVEGTMRKESYCKWASPFVAKAASKYCMQSGFKVRSRHFWPYPTSQHQRWRKKKLKMSTWMWHPNARCPTHRVKVGRYAAMQLTHLSRDVQRGVCCHFIEIQNHNEHSRTTPIAVAILKLWNLTKWSGCVGAWRRSSPVLIWSKFFSKPIFGFPDPGLHTVQSV